MEDEQEAGFYRELMDNQQERDHYRQLQDEAIPDIGHHRALEDLHVPYFDPVRDRFDDSYSPDASGDRPLMEPPWLGDR